MNNLDFIVITQKTESWDTFLLWLGFNIQVFTGSGLGQTSTFKSSGLRCCKGYNIEGSKSMIRGAGRMAVKVTKIANYA